MANYSRVGPYRRKDGTIVKGHTREKKAPRTKRGEAFIASAFPNIREGDPYKEQIRDRLTREPWTWLDLENRRKLKKAYPERYAHLHSSYNLYHERYNKPEGSVETPRFTSYPRMIKWITDRGYRYVGYTSFIDGSWIGYYTETPRGE